MFGLGLKERRDAWIRAVRATAEALVELMLAELAALAQTWKDSGRDLLIVMGLLAVIMSSLFWLMALLIFGSVQAIHSAFGWTVWQAASAVAVGLVLLIVALVAVVVFLLRRMENPFESARIRLEDHVRWWREQAFGTDRELLTGEEFDEAELEEAARRVVAAGDRAGGSEPPEARAEL